MKKIFFALVFFMFIARPSAAETIVIPAVVHASGANGVFWKTAIGIYNASNEIQNISARNILGEGEIPSAQLQPGQFINTDDLGILFNAGEGIFLVELNRTDPNVLFTVRTYNVTGGQLGQSSTLLFPVYPVTQHINLVFSRVGGAKKVLFLYGDSHAECMTASNAEVHTYSGTAGILEQKELPNDVLGCTVTVDQFGFPSGGDPDDYYAYAWASEIDDISNCPTLITAEQP